MDLVSSVVAFAASQPDYWTDLLSDGDYPRELSKEERVGLDAAREHINEAVVTLLRLCAARFFERLGKKQTRKKAFQWGATARNRRIDLHAPNGSGEKLYRLEFSLWGDASRKQPIALWSSLVAKKKYHQPIGALLSRANVEYDIDDYHVTALPGIPLSEGSPFVNLADEAATSMIALVTATNKARSR